MATFSLGYNNYTVTKFKSHTTAHSINNQVNFYELWKSIFKIIYPEKKLDFNKDFINNQIKFKENSAFNDSLRTVTIQNFNQLDLFNFPSISYNYFNGSDELLEANIILNSKKNYQNLHGTN